jgi:ABC-type branched-subunit amino acid transport system ATPase component
MLRVERVSRDFGGLRALNRVSLEVKENQIFSLVGPNGAGKTTLFNLLSGLLPVSAGKIYFKGTDITDLAPHHRAVLGLGRTFQNIKLFHSCNAIENVIIAQYSRSKSGLFKTLFRLPHEHKAIMMASAESILDQVGLYSKRYTMSSQLSFADQRRLGIARALALKPSMLLLDEPTPGMVAIEMLELKDLILKLRDEGITVFLIEHNMDLVMDISDYVAVLNFGQNLAEGKPEDLVSNPDVIKAYLGSE